MSKVLFVSSDVKMVSSWQDVLLLGGYKVDAAITGEEAVKRALSGAPDIILIDEKDSSRDIIIKHLKKEIKTRAIPVMDIESLDITRSDIVLKNISEILKKKKVLIAEDDRQMSSILKAVLETRNYDIKVTYDGAETLKEVKSWQPELLVLDIMLPIIDGFHICQNINEDPAYELKPKVLIISGRESDWDKNLGEVCGAECYLVKPFDNLYFLEKVQEILNN
ncbi:MAG: response regulator [Elusimicrobia bacterium]|nr:response regulator [Candidatus Liberimonas magnetica]